MSETKNKANNPIETLRAAIRKHVAAGADLMELIEAASKKADEVRAANGHNNNDETLVRAAMIDVYFEINGEEAGDKLLDKLLM